MTVPANRHEIEEGFVPPESVTQVMNFSSDSSAISKSRLTLPVVKTKSQVPAKAPRVALEVVSVLLAHVLAGCLELAASLKIPFLPIMF